MSSTIFQIPAFVLVRIFRYLSNKDLYNVSLTCSKASGIAKLILNSRKRELEKQLIPLSSCSKDVKTRRKKVSAIELGEGDMSGWLVKQGGSLKPVIYLYPTQIQSIDISITFSKFYKLESLICIPEPSLIKNQQITWNSVLAYPDGRLKYKTNEILPYLFYEVNRKPCYNILSQENYKFAQNEIGNGNFSSQAWMVSKLDLFEFLLLCCIDCGLSNVETNEFIGFWFIRLINQNSSNFLIRFLKHEYSDDVLLNIEPKPDIIIRCYMCVKLVTNLSDFQNVNKYCSFGLLNERLNSLQLQLEENRKDKFVIVEWGGMFC